MNCNGVHTIFIRNNNISHVLSGDIYSTNTITNTIRLVIGPVGIVAPLRGNGGSGGDGVIFNCRIQLLDEDNNPIPTGSSSGSRSGGSSSGSGTTTTPPFITSDLQDMPDLVTDENRMGDQGKYCSIV